MAKDKGGHPPKYETPAALEKKIDEYFETRQTEYAKDSEGNIKSTANGPVIISLNAPSITGMALYLGFASRQSIHDQEKREGFSYVSKKARAKVEEWVYQAVMSGAIQPSVGIFMLKQFGYTDKQQIEHSVDTTAYDELKKLYGQK